MDRTTRQKLGIKKWIDAKGKATLVYGTGVGKTYTAIMAIQLLLKSVPNAYVLIVVPTKVLKEQWIAELIKHNIFTNCQVEVINSVINKKWNCDLLIIDEVHRAASEHFSQIFNSVVYKMILCLTATIKRLDGKENIIKKYAPVVDIITLEEAEANGWISPVKNYLVLLDVDLTEYNKLNQKFNAYFAYFNYDFNLAMRLVTNWQERTKWARKMGVTPKDATAMAFDWNRALKARKDFIANHPKKLEICQRILNARKDKKCIVFAPTIKVCELVGTDYILHSKCTKKKNSETLTQFNNSSFGSISSSKALTEGVDVKGLSVGIIMNVNSSKITAVQKRGRICRFEPGKKAEMFTLVLKGTQEYQWFQNSNIDSVITINEEQLNKILNGEEIQTRERESLIDTQFRF